MILSSLSLQDFRNYTKKTLTFSSGTTLILGSNSSGKTNLLEALWILSLGRSFRAEKETEVVRWGSDVGRIKGVVALSSDQQGGTVILEVVVTRGFVAGRKTPIKRFFVNGVAKRMIDFAGNFRVVLFWPEHLALVTDSPGLRRRYLDSVLSQVDREYRRSLGSYERGLAQRNKLLDFINEGKASRSQLHFWDQLLIKTGGYLTDTRASFIEFVNARRESSMDYVIEYNKSVISDARILQYEKEEVAAKATLVGPHRDDFQFYTTPRGRNGKHRVNVSTFGSRGEQRVAILWLKLAEIAFVERSTGERPVLLLDDIFSELDSAHRKLVLDLIGKQQTIVTSADHDIRSLLVGEHGNAIEVVDLMV